MRVATTSIGALAEAAGGLEELLARYAVVVVADHGQSRVHEVTRLEERFAGVEGALVAASNRAGQVYRLDECRLDAAQLAQRLDGHAGVDVSLRREGDDAVARKDGEELRFAPRAAGGWALSGDASILAHPDGLRRAWTALANPNAGELLVSPSDGVEFADLGGRHHLPGGSHGSLAIADSEVPVVTVGIDGEVESIVDIAPLVLRHFGVSVPPYARAFDRAA